MSGGSQVRVSWSADPLLVITPMNPVGGLGGRVSTTLILTSRKDALQPGVLRTVSMSSCSSVPWKSWVAAVRVSYSLVSSSPTVGASENLIPRCPSSWAVGAVMVKRLRRRCRSSRLRCWCRRSGTGTAGYRCPRVFASSSATSWWPARVSAARRLGRPAWPVPPAGRCPRRPGARCWPGPAPGWRPVPRTR